MWSEKQPASRMLFPDWWPAYWTEVQCALSVTSGRSPALLPKAPLASIPYQPFRFRAQYPLVDPDSGQCSRRHGVIDAAEIDEDGIRIGCCIILQNCDIRKIRPIGRAVGVHRHNDI